MRWNGSGSTVVEMGGVGIAVLGPSVDLQEKVAGPAGAKGREGAGVEPQRHLVAGAHDGQAVVDFAEQAANLAVARVEAGSGVPEGCRRDFGSR